MKPETGVDVDPELRVSWPWGPTIVSPKPKDAEAVGRVVQDIEAAIGRADLRVRLLEEALRRVKEMQA